MRKGEARHDSHRTGKSRVPFHETKLLARNDKFLAAGNKCIGPRRTYKTRTSIREPRFTPTELTIGLRDRIPELNDMEKHPKTIAVVDDDIGIRQALQRMLSIAGFRVHAFASGEEFLAAVDTCGVGCVVIDVDLGTMCGLDLARHPSVVAANLPLIFISGTCDETVRTRARALRCFEYLRKPFTPAELLDAIHRATDELSLL